MHAERLLQHFERISEVPDATPRLRRFILDLAVRGKLVEQDPNDEPAAELLKRIEAEKKRLVKEGKIKEQKPLHAVEPDMAPYKLPPNWKWVKFGETVNSHLGGATPSKNNSTYWDGDIYWASVKDIGNGKYVDQTVDRISEAGLVNSSSNLIPAGNLIVVTRMGLGKVSINRVPIAINQDLRALFLSSLTDIDYYYIFLKTHEFEGTGLTVKGVKLEELLNIVFPLPPLAEQYRIVAKVDELMTLCDQLEAAKTEREQRRDRLVAASLHRLNQPVDTAETDALDLPARQTGAFQDHARFVFTHLSRLTTYPAHIKQLRQTILNLAVRGKLVPQDPNDEPAAELLKRIQAEKMPLQRQGLNAGEKLPLTGLPTNPPFSIPTNWQWAQFIDYATDISTGPFGSILHQSDYVKGGVPLVNPSHMVNGRIVPEQHVAVSCETAKRLSTYKLYAGDIVMARRGEVGRAAVVYEKEAGWLCGTGSFFLRFTEEVSREYIMVLLRCEFVRKYLAGEAVGITMVNLNHGILKRMPLPLPPLAEQHRIVAKVDELMALCDQLEAQLTTIEADSRRLLEAVLYEALHPPLAATEHMMLEANE
jgi:type I restriction enzyme, S subunit